METKQEQKTADQLCKAPIRVKQVKHPDQYKFYNDPGHGWLEVTKSELLKLGVADKITSYSYEKGPKAYLEEDCDLATFLKAKVANGEVVEYEDIYQDPTFVRDLPPYEAPPVARCNSEIANFLDPSGCLQKAGLIEVVS